MIPLFQPEEQKHLRHASTFFCFCFFFCTFCSATHPVVLEIVQDQSGPEGAGRVDAASRVADLKRAAAGGRERAVD